MQITEILKDSVDLLQSNGCSPFFFTGAIQSVIFGGVARENQSKMLDSNLEFRQHLQDLKDEYSREHLDAQLFFRRESYELGRQYMIQQTMEMNKTRKKQADFIDFINHYWPLEQSVYSVLMEREKFLALKSIVPLTVYIAKTELTSSVKDLSKYEQFCEELISFAQPYGVIVEKCPWKNVCQSCLSEAMNINYIMGGIPTLLVFPYLHGNTIGIETAAWSFVRGLQSMNHSKSLQIKNDEPELVYETTKSAVKATIGMTRDAYMLAEYHAPIMFGKDIEEEIMVIPEIRSRVVSHYQEMSKLIGNSDFRGLCTPDELSEIDKSLNFKLLKF